MKDKRRFDLPSNKIINKRQLNIVELLEFRIYTDSDRNDYKTYMLNIAKIHLVVPCPKEIFLNKDHQHEIGTAIVRGQVIPIIDLRKELGYTSKDFANCDVIVIHFLGKKYGALVDRVIRIHYLNWSEIKPVEQSKESYLTGVTQIDDKIFGLVDLERISEQIFASDEKSDFKSMSPLQNKKIALVDDSYVLRDKVQKVLSSYGQDIELMTYHSAISFLDQQASRFYNFDIIIIDVEMPQMSGLTLVRKMRELKEYEDTRIYLYSSLENKDIQAQSIQLQVDGYVIKNNLESLLRKISQDAN